MNEDNVRKYRWIAKNPVKFKEAKKREYEKNKSKYLARANIWRKTDKYKNAYFKRNYNITLEQYNKMYMKQLGLCAICHNPFGNKIPCVDHCHRTNRVRGLVHNACNKAIGLLKDDADTLMFASEYLRK